MTPIETKVDGLRLRLAAEASGITDPAIVATLKVTHDNQAVYPVGATLPPGASGFVQCRLSGGAYSTWLEPEDQPRSREDSRRIAAEAHAFRSKLRAAEALRELGVRYPDPTLRGMRTQYIVAKMRRLWPLRENPKPNTPSK